MALRRMFRRSKPAKRNVQVVDLTDEARRRPGPRQHWSRRPPEVAAAPTAQGPAWAPASWRVGTDDSATPHVRRDEAAAVQAETGESVAVQVRGDQPAAVGAGNEDVLTVAAREIDRMAQEIRKDAPEDVELSVLQEHARRVEMLTRANPFLNRK